jgi:hypothetical protein
MVTVVFITMFLALVLAWFGQWRLAGAVLTVCVCVYVAEFLWEVWSPVYGFEMPWLQGDARPFVIPREA